MGRSQKGLGVGVSPESGCGARGRKTTFLSSSLGLRAGELEKREWIVVHEAGSQA